MKFALQVIILGVTSAIPSLGSSFWSGLGLHRLGVPDGGLGGGGIDLHAGLGQPLHFGRPIHFSQYTRGAEARHFGFQIGGELGPWGAGASAGIGNGQFGFSGIFELDKKMKKPDYRPFYYTPYRGPWLRPRRNFLSNLLPTKTLSGYNCPRDLRAKRFH